MPGPKSVTFRPKDPTLWDRMKRQYNKITNSNRQGYEPLLEAMLTYCHSQGMFIPDPETPEVVESKVETKQEMEESDE